MVLMPANKEHRNIYGACIYPGRRSDYLSQAFRFTAVVMCSMAGLYALVLGADVFLLGERHVGPVQFVLVLGMGGLLGLFSFIMAFSLSRFRVTAGSSGITVNRGSGEMKIPYGMITNVEKVRIPGWWPLRADLKPGKETVRAMIRIGVRDGRPLTFISGLVGEEELLETIRKEAGLEEEKREE